MREHKYRAWNKTKKIMLQIKSVDFSQNKLMCKYLGCNTSPWEDIDDFILMEYTGQKDCYEGDLIPYHFNKEVKGIVKFGEYSNPCDDIHTRHIGYFVEFNDDKYKNVLRKDLGYWLGVSHVDGNICEAGLW